MFSLLFTSAADALISYAVDKLDPAERITSWLKQDPARIAFQKALARAYSAFARQYPEYTSSLFDQSFLSKEAIPEISKLLIRNQHPDPALLAKAWGKSIGAKPEFASRATKPMSDFLMWLEAELKAEQIFQALYDSRALDSLPRLEAEIEKLTKELTSGLAAALKIANEYERIAIKVEGDIKDSNVILGDGNQINVSNIYNTYYTGAFDKLNDFYVQPDSVFQRVRVDEFVGRDWLTAKVDAFLNEANRKSGAFLLIGEAGVGKTSFMAHLVKERRYLHLFAEQVAGDANLQRALQSLGSQLITRYQIDPYKDRDTLTQLAVFPDFLERLLRLAASTLTNGEKIVIVCDALDEAGTFPDGNVFGLPNILPDGVYFILSQRPVNTKLPNFEPLRFNLESQGADNLQDMQTYLSAVAKRPEVAGQIRSKEYSEAFFIQTLKEKSLGVWMYLHYIIKEIESGSRAPLDLENLPTGLTGYYADYWDDWRYGRRGRGKGEEAWNSLYSPLLTTLAAAQEAITVEQLIKWANVKATSREVSQLLNQLWRSFITVKEIEKSKSYSPYHLSFRDFIKGKVDFSKLDPKREGLVRDLSEQTIEAHVRIVRAFEEECESEWPKIVEQDYPRLYLCAHLAGAKEYKKLTDLLTEGNEHIRWAEARYQKEETYAGYINDLSHVWEFAEQEQNYALAIRCMLIENSIHSLAANIPPELLSELVKTSLWSYARCLSIIRQKSDTNDQIESLKLIMHDLPPSLSHEVLAVVQNIKDTSERVALLTDLVPRLNGEFKATVIQDIFFSACEIENEQVRANALSELAPHLDEEFKILMLVAARKIHDGYARVSTLSRIVPFLNEELKTQILQEILSAVHKIKSEDNRADILRHLIPHLNDELKKYALSIIFEINNEYARSNILADFAPHLTDKLKKQVLSVTWKMESIPNRARVLFALAPHLDGELKSRVLENMYSEIRNSKDKRISALSSLTPYLTDELKPQVYKEAFLAANEMKDKNARARAMSALALHFDGDIRLQALQKALVATRDIESLSARASALIFLAPHLNKDMKEKVVYEALNVARKIEDEIMKVRALSNIASHLNEDDKAQVLHEALSMAYNNKIEYEGDRARIFATLAPHFSAELQQQVLQEALSAAHKVKKRSVPLARTLFSLTSYVGKELKSHLLQEALSVAHEIKDSATRIPALIGLLPYVSKDIQLQLLTRLLAVVSTFEEGSQIAHTWMLIKPYVNQDIMLNVLSIMCEIKEPFWRARVLIDLIPYLAGELKPQVLDTALVAAHEINDESDRAHTLSDLIPHLSDPLKAQTLHAALATACEIKDESHRAHTLSDLAPHLSDELKLQAVATAYEIKDEYRRVYALTDLTPYLSDGLKAQTLHAALAAAGKIKEEDHLAYALSNLASHMSDELKIQGLAVARKIKDEYYRAYALFSLAQHLTDELKVQIFGDVLIIAREIQDESNRAGILSLLAPHLSDELKIQAMAAACEIKDKSNRARTLSELAPHLNDELKAQAFYAALSAAREIENELDRARTLSDLAPHLSDEHKAQALYAALVATREIENETDRASTLYYLAPQLSYDLKAQALTIAREINSQYDRAHALSNLAPHLNDELKIQALAAIREIKGRYDRVYALSSLMPHLSEELKAQVLHDALVVAREIKNEYRRVHAISLLGLRLNKESKKAVLQELLFIAGDADNFDNFLESEGLANTFNMWEGIEYLGLKEKMVSFIYLISQKNREYGMEVIRILLPALIHLSGKEVASELYRAIVDTARWWP